jgi:hypothetical protein
MGVHQRGVREILNGGIDLLTSTVKVMLLGTATVYTYNPDNNFVDAAGANDPIDAELTGVSGYTGGFGGAGRKTLASKTVTQDDTNNRNLFDAADVLWTALGAGGTIDQAEAIVEITNDAASILLANFDVTNTATNGSDISLQWNSAGLIAFNTV